MDNKLYILFPHMKKDIPLFILFKALGCLSDKEIIYYIIDNNKSEIDPIMLKIIKNSLIEASEYKTEYDAGNTTSITDP